MRRFALLALVVTTACSSKTIEEETTAVQRGEKLASDPGFAETPYNAFACTTCHAVSAPPPGKTLPGAPLGGAIRRKSYWNGRIVTLADAVDECAQKFMRAAPFDPKARKWIDLWAWLESIADKGPKEPQPFEVVYEIKDLPKGNPEAGRAVWQSACATCHGAPKTGEGRLLNAAGFAPATIVPNDTIAEHQKDGPEVVRQVVIEKIRHGSYLGFPGVMPPFSKQTLTDAQISDLLTYLELH